ncbi:MAG TPA: GNAT family N-acetyltransferase [Gammaproteobacteria bacterium]|nr:GNAT family N-acetyltransferase [Gammaproteobacteria bacterium]|tara:strand:+ start:6135 stop:7991 length:1857 start_codon:yes stop_codon:yes gene_type:complete
MDVELKKKLRNCDSEESLKALLREIRAGDLLPKEVEFLNHVMDKINPTAESTIAFLANHTIDPMARYTRVQCALNGAFISTYIGEYDQHFQEVLDSGSGLHQKGPDIIFLSLLLSKIAPQVAHQFTSLDLAEKEQEIDRIVSQITEWAEVAKETTDATILISNFSRPGYSQSGLADLQLSMSEAEFYARLNLELASNFRNDQRIFVFDTDHILACSGKAEAMDRKMYHLAKMAWSERANMRLADELCRYVHAVRRPAKKCLVVDLDNTLWGGVVGEDGLHGIKIGQGDAESEAYSEFQYAIRSLLDRGIVLAICSKNNSADVDEVFQNREDMILKKDDFSVIKVNWNPKYLNIQEIADELNISIDSLVFIDDNPAECELVKEALPEVTTIHLSGDPSGFTDILNHLNTFEKLVLTQEDKTKYIQYRQNAERETKKRSFRSMEDYLKSLGTTISIREASQQDVPRVHQLFTKTNQFNVTTKRYSAADIESFIQDSSFQLKLFQVKDNFGDLGIVGLYLVHVGEDQASIDSFVLSCRALGRGVETFIMNQIKEEFLFEKGFGCLTASFIPTAKNVPAANFYNEQGFIKTGQSEGEELYEMRKQDAKLIDCAAIQANVSED